jgi:branched-chain amino acid transport system permease protein
MAPSICLVATWALRLRRTVSFILGGVTAVAAAAAAGWVLSAGLLRFVQGHDLRQVLLTLGVAFVVNDMALVIWGGDTFTVPIPEMLCGAVQVFGVFYPTYRLFVLAAVCVIFGALWLLLQRTRIGALIRAGVDDAEMVEASGINIKQVFLVTFLLGSALAGFGGLLGGAFLSLYPRRTQRFWFSALQSSSSVGEEASRA